MPHRFVLALTVLFSTMPSLVSAQWGDLKFTFVYDGKPPVAKPLPVGGAMCGAVPVDETWVVNPMNGGVQNVVVYLLPDKDAKLPMHPSFVKAAGTTVRIDNKGCRFEPHVTIKYTNQNLDLTNGDAFGHNVKADFFENVSFNILIPAGDTQTIKAGSGKLDQHEPSASPLSCSIHPFMSGRLFIHSHPYSGISDKDGVLTIKNAPVGDWTFVMWHEGVGYIKEGTLGAALKKWPKGRIKVEVVPGVTTVGMIKFK